MKCLSIAQPWAWLIMQGVKAIENRTWRTQHRGDLLIHTGIRRDILKQCYADDSLCGLLPDQSKLVFGAIVGIVNVAGCLRKSDLLEGDLIKVPLKQAMLKTQKRFIEGPWCWLLEDPRLFDKPIRYSGEQGLFEYPDSSLPVEVMDGKMWRI